MKKLLFAGILLCGGVIEAAEKEYKVPVHNATKLGKQLFFYYKDGTYGGVLFNPNEVKTVSLIPLESVTLGYSGSLSKPAEYVKTVSSEENIALKEGKAYIIIQTDEGSKKDIIRILPVQPQAQQPEQKKEAVSLEVRVFNLEAALANANTRISTLEAEVRSLKQQLQPGS